MLAFWLTVVTVGTGVAGEFRLAMGSGVAIPGEVSTGASRAEELMPVAVTGTLQTWPLEKSTKNWFAKAATLAMEAEIEKLKGAAACRWPLPSGANLRMRPWFWLVSTTYTFVPQAANAEGTGVKPLKLLVMTVLAVTVGVPLAASVYIVSV